MNRKAFTLIELLVVVAIIGILAAVGVVAYNGYTSAAKKNIVWSNHAKFLKWVNATYMMCIRDRHMRAELTKCNAGLADTMFKASPQTCPITHANNWVTGMNNSCRGSTGIYYNMKNPYKTSDRACRLNISYTGDADVGYINWSTKSATDIRLSSCWKTPCNTTSNREEIIINVTD